MSRDEHRRAAPRPTVGKRRLYLLIAAIVVELVIATVVRVDALQSFLSGRHDVVRWVAVVGLGWSIVVALAAGALGRSLSDARRTLHRQSQAIAADASTSVDWLWEADVRYTFTYSSDGVVELLGYRPDEIIGMSALTMLATDQVGPVQRLLEHALTSRTGWAAVELTWTHRDGSPVILQGTAAPIVDERRRLVGFRGTQRRVTEAMATERAVVAARRRVTDVLDERNLDIALQPIVDVNQGRLVGVEALARFRDGRSVDDWFREAAMTGHGLSLDGLTFRTALELLDELPDDCYLSVNATPELVTSGGLVEALGAGAFPLERLVVEITEHVKINSYADLHTSLIGLRERGVRLAVDDTGAGYASFSHVLQLRPDIIKIDRSLISDVGTDPARRSLVTALVLLGLDLGASVTGEGVETLTELRTLAALGVDCAQGYLLGAPTKESSRHARWFERDWRSILTEMSTAPDEFAFPYPADA